VIAGTKFHFEMSYRVFENGDKGKADEDLFDNVIDGLKLIEKDALGAQAVGMRPSKVHGKNSGRRRVS